MGWQFWIDRGGTFTDIVARAPDGHLITEKLLSENPGQYEDAAVAGMRKMLGLADDSPFPSDRVDAIKMGTTVATNALLERNGERTLLAITQGFADALFIGTQNRPRLFDLKINRPGMLYSDTLEIQERLYADGSVETPLNAVTARDGLRAAFENGFRAVAITFLHADRFPAHEQHVAEIAAEIGFEQISASHDVIPLMKLIGRGDTTVADAFLSPILRRYVDRIDKHVKGCRLFFMQSNGGLTDAMKFRGKDAILSGPAGGVVGLAGIAKTAGLEKVIGFDMGGTSTDVSHFTGSFERSFDTTIAGVRIRAPMMQINTVAAGGGSMCVFDGLRFRVGPESAGALPGPVAYRQGGPLTITDCNVLLGRIQTDYFPYVLGPKANEPLDKEAVAEAFTTLSRKVSDSIGHERSPEELAEGYLALAIENMANAIKTISVQRGYDVTDYTLVCFGAAGGQHACGVADALGIGRVLIHPLSGVLSAYGMGLADLRELRERTIALLLSEENYVTITWTINALSKKARKSIVEQGVAEEKIVVTQTVYLRYEGSDTALPVPYGPVLDMRSVFEQDHRRLFGFLQENKDLIIESVSVEALGGGLPVEQPLLELSLEETVPTPLETVAMVSSGKRWQTPVYARDALNPGDLISGPAMVVEANATTVIEAEWQAEVTQQNHLILSRATHKTEKPSLGVEADPVKVEIFNSLFMAIAEQMGAALQNTAHSVNIKERLDFSCAIFDRVGALVANAPHMPVHLGSMGESVRAILSAHHDNMNPGDAFLTNAPYNGGTHLPDVTVVAPLFDSTTGERMFFVAARGHHADIGGISPGSMPPNSRTIDEEGILFDAVPVLRDGQVLENEIRSTLSSGAFPARNVNQNLADLRAQIAACAKGTTELLSMIEQFGRAGVKAYTSHVQNNAEEAVRRVIGNLNDGYFTAPMDDGSHIQVTISVDKETRSATIDFTGTSEQRLNNFNAPAAVCKAAVLYVFRTLIVDDIPMNEGCLKPLELIIPEGSMLNPQSPAAVVAGNVETSQVICDALYGALGRLAASQGTMNNLTFGNDAHQYYETLCGGSGAGPGFDGCDAVHTHMTNSRLTDPEVLEWRYPVLVESFEVRKNSGGVGRNRGGNGVIRRIRFLESMTAAILSGRRITEPFGLDGGQNGKSGETWIERADGSRTKLGFADSTEVSRGDTIVITTPGGGGFGAPN